MTEIEEAIGKVNDTKKDERKITLKDEPISDLLLTFDDNKMSLQSIFDQRKNQLYRHNYGNGYDFLTVLSRTLTSDQQKEMYWRLCAAFVGDSRKYIQNPMVS